MFILKKEKKKSYGKLKKCTVILTPCRPIESLVFKELFTWKFSNTAAVLTGSPEYRTDGVMGAGGC